MCAIFMEQIHIEHIPEIGMRPMGSTHYTFSYIPVHTVFFSLEFSFIFHSVFRIKFLGLLDPDLDM
jgi:hypothetical protein